MSAARVNGQPGADINSDDKDHKTVFGATGHQIKHAAGAYENDRYKAQASVSPEATQQPVSQHGNGIGDGPQIKSSGQGVDVVCGPLLNYRHMSAEHSESPIWHGSVLLVVQPGQVPGELSISQGGNTGVQGHTTQNRSFTGTRLYEDSKKAFFQYSIEVPFLDQETTWDYSIPNMRIKAEKPLRFVVPSKHESMRIMFHSCNGFSVGTDEEEWSGPALWNDVLRIHQERPIHVMVGGGDQIYNDSVRVTGPLKEWTAIGNPIKRRDFPFNEELRAKCDEFYLDNYVRWYNTAPFSTANGQIAQVNIWDDHDIIDGFGSYTDHFMKCAVFRGIGGTALKYYLLFQHHVAPPVSTFTTDAPQTTRHHFHKPTPVDSVQMKDTFVLTKYEEDPSYLLGQKPGPYVEERSRSLYCQLGKSIALLGLDARTERTRHQVNYPETYDMLFRHAEEKLVASNGAIKHLILLLGIPIAYPRLQWLENILSSPIIGPVKFLNKRFGLAGGFFNQFDGKPDLLDDLDDHYTARTHKKERKQLVLRLQKLSQRTGVRITILGGDVHLAAMGRFFSKASLNIPVEQDFRFMPNIISSAITNHPPPQAVANLLARRNKVHHLDHDTDETLLEIFNEDPGKGREGLQAKSADSNHATMPSRNFAIISESHSSTASNGHVNGGNAEVNGVDATGEFAPSKNPRQPMHRGELNAGTSHPAASGTTYTGLGGAHGLDVAYRVEIDHSDRQGRTQGYGLSIPALEAGVNGHAVKH
ncbi:hypothetical protein AMS68_007229 [Peltaster fructicola]|uniref:PhoD-like phosphatase domain-containing protein n=1 Tax=Peltaster fructicola TaxID=286661 RepID=A0A6H0Y3V9_9PEZI|nr:hypothetical protein AMS68_007229 [Peltaster fructicola]